MNIFVDEIFAVVTVIIFIIRSLGNNTINKLLRKYMLNQKKTQQREKWDFFKQRAALL